MHLNKYSECNLTGLKYISEIWSLIGCSTNRPVDAPELNIQLDTEVDRLAKEPGWCVSLDASLMDMWMYTDTVVITFDAQQTDMMMHSDSVNLLLPGQC